MTYFLPENFEENLSNTPRGAINLSGALINPSDEDSRTFTINPAAGEVIKLKANDARSRQEVNSEVPRKNNLIMVLYISQWVDGLRAVVENLSTQDRSPLPPREHLAAYDCLQTCRKQLQDMEICNAKLSQIIENAQGPLNYNDIDLLLLKAISAATSSTLSVGFAHLQKYQDGTREMF